MSQFESRDRRLLLIARDFPPASTSAALRALKLARRLTDHGWNVSAVSARGAFERAHDPELPRQLPPHCRTYPAFGFDTKVALSVRGRYPRLLSTPDRDVSWLVHGVLTALRAWRADAPKLLWSTSPPVTAHCIGLALKRITRLPWIVELRDPWNLDVPSGALSHALDRRLERHMLRAADAIIVTTDGLAADLGQRLGTLIAAKITVIHNGYEEEGFPTTPAAAGGFRVAHIGECTPPQRDPLPFLRALRQCLDSSAIPIDTEVLFAGAGAAFEKRVADEIARLRLTSNVRSSARLSHGQALQAMREASLLLALQTRSEHRDCVPAKVYEYLRSQRCILAVTPGGSATAEFLSRFPGVLQATPSQPQQIALHLAEAYRAWHQSDSELRFERRIERYSIESVTVELARLLDRVSSSNSNHDGVA